jgi:hypothetical protein
MFNAQGGGSVWYDDLSFFAVNSTVPAGLGATLVLVTPEVGILGVSGTLALWDQAAYISALSYPGTALVGANRDFGILSEQYQPQMPSDPTTSPRQYPPQDWNVDQTWLYLPDRMVGSVNMTSTVTHQDRYVRMRIRTEPGPGVLEETSSNHFTAAGLNVTLIGNNFPKVFVGPDVDSDNTGNSVADEIFLEEAAGVSGTGTTYPSGTSHGAVLNVAPSTTDALSGYNALTSGSLIGFRAAEDLKQYIVYVNTLNSSGTLNYNLGAPGSWVMLNNLYIGGTATALAIPTIITGTTVSAIVPPYGTACIESTRNLVPNYGFEQVTSGTATDYTYENLSGNIVPAIDSTVHHSGYNSLKLSGNGSSEGGVAQSIPTLGGKDYQFTYWYKSDNVIGANAIVSRLTRSATWDPAWISGITGGTYIISGDVLTITAANATPGAWNSITISFSLPDTSLKIECLNWLGNGSVWYDDLSFMQWN